MPLHFKTKEGFRKWTAYKHMHDIPSGKDKGTIWIAGKVHKVKHANKR